MRTKHSKSKRLNALEKLAWELVMEILADASLLLRNIERKQSPAV